MLEPNSTKIQSDENSLGSSTIGSPGAAISSLANGDLVSIATEVIKAGDPKLMQAVLRDLDPSVAQRIPHESASAVRQSLVKFALIQDLSPEQAKTLRRWLEGVNELLFDDKLSRSIETQVEERLDLIAFSERLLPQSRDSKIWTLLKTLDEQLAAVDKSKSADYTCCQNIYMQLVALDNHNIRDLARILQIGRREAGSAIERTTWTWAATALADTPTGLRHLADIIDDCTRNVGSADELLTPEQLDDLRLLIQVLKAVTTKKERANGILPYLQAILKTDNPALEEVRKFTAHALKEITGSEDGVSSNTPTASSPSALESEPVHKSDFFGMKVFRSINKDPTNLKRVFDRWLASKHGYEIIHVNSPNETNWVSVTYKAPAGSSVDDGKEIRF